MQYALYSVMKILQMRLYYPLSSISNNISTCTYMLTSLSAVIMMRMHIY